MNAASFKLRDAASYDPVTDSFDRFTQRLTAPLARELVRAARIAPGQAVLDVGTGTGVVALAAARQTGPGGTVTGVDLSDGMLASAAAAAAAAAGAIEFRKMDAEALDFPPDSFDAVVSLYALFHFPNPAAAVREMARVLRPGGRFAVGVGAGPRLLSRAGVGRAAARVAALFGRGRRLVAPGSLVEFLDRRLPAEAEAEAEVTDLSRQPGVHRAILQMVREAGLDDLRQGWSGGEARYDSAEEFWEVQATFSSAARKRLAAAPAGTAVAVREEFVSMCRDAQLGGGQLVYPFGAYFVSGRKPTPAGGPRG